MNTHSFLLEITTEELPPTSLRQVAQRFADEFSLALQQAELSYHQLHWFATPRRLAIQVKQLAHQQPDKQIEKRGPSLAQAFDAQGTPTAAADKWAERCQISLKQAEIWQTEKGSWLRYCAQISGKLAETLLIDCANQALKNLKLMPLMHWGEHPFPFIRPIQGVVALLDDQQLPGKVLGIATSRTLQGHRFLGEVTLTLQHADEYPQILLKHGHVMADFAERQRYIRHQITTLATQLEGEVDLDEMLLEEVTALVEWPVILSATFDRQFLEVPAEALVYTMKKDQRYFPLYDQQKQLLPKFIFVANNAPADPSAIIRGNQQVIRPRLADAQFFFNRDRRQPLENLLPRLKTMLFQQQLGTLFDKAQRLQSIARQFAILMQVDLSQAARAALLAKCDLASHLVSEFPATQGIMGMHYARLSGESEAVAQAIQAHYQPRFSGDVVPQQPIACVVALADKLDTLVGIIGIGALPKSDKDPFALRRAALGVVRILVENQLPLALPSLIAITVLANHPLRLPNEQVASEVLDFILNRLRYWYQDQGFSNQLIQAVLTQQSTIPADIAARLHALSLFSTTETAQTLVTANKRVTHLLTKIGDPVELPLAYDSALLTLAAEQQLAHQINHLQETLPLAINAQDYSAALMQLTTLSQPLEHFFNEVMVLVDDPKLRLNRLQLLYAARQLFLQVADISQL